MAKNVNMKKRKAIIKIVALMLALINFLFTVSCGNSIGKTYGTRAEEELSAAKYMVARKDQKLVDALKRRLGESIAIYVGDTRVIYNGFFHKLDTADYTRAAKKEGNSILIPSEFAKKYFGDDINVDADGYFDLTAYCSANLRYSLYTDGDKLYIVYPESVRSFEKQNTKLGGYTNKQYIERIIKFFTDEFLPEPTINAESSRVVIAEALYPENVADHTKQQYVTTYSPAIAINVINGQKIIYASYEYSTVLNGEELSTLTALSISLDNGTTWTEIAKIDDLRWASMFILDDQVYLMGNSVKTGASKIARLKTDNTFEAAEIAKGIGGGAPGAVIVHEGRIYRAYLSVVSADITDDLLDPASWTYTNSVRDIIDKDWYMSVATKPDITINVGVGEGNIVVGPDGNVYAIYRLGIRDHIGYAILVKVSDDGSTLSIVDSCDSLIWMETAVSKFSVRYDEMSELYYALVSTPTVEGEYHQRTVLSLVYSADMINWTTATSVLVDRELMNEHYAARMHGYQYADFVFDGNDIIMVVRETTGYSNWFHDGKWTTFYRIEDFRKLTF